MSEGFCYVARKEGQPGAYAACADMKDLPKETARFISDMVKEGAYVERVPTQTARDMLGEWLKWKDRHDAASRSQGESK
jgi:hypothetical protein